MIDNTIAFLSNPATFIHPNLIALNDIAQNMGTTGIPAVNNLRTNFTLSQNTVGGLPGPNDFPMLRMQPLGSPPGQPVNLPGGGRLNTIDAMYCRVADGGVQFNNMPYCDIPIAPGLGAPRFLFTTGMNGCSLIIASVVPTGAAPLAMGHYRVLHDRNHRNLEQWRLGGYRVRFASYADAAEPGPVPPTFVGIRVNIYNPHNYPWIYFPTTGSPPMRVVTNFLYWTGTVWTFNSRHYHTAGTLVLNVDAPPGTPPPAASSTQSLPI